MRSWMDDAYTFVDKNFSWISKIPIGLGVVGLITLARHRYWMRLWPSIAHLPAEVKNGDWVFRIRVIRCLRVPVLKTDAGAKGAYLDLVAKHEPVLSFLIPSKNTDGDPFLHLRLAGVELVSGQNAFSWLQRRLTGRTARVRILQLLGNDVNNGNQIALCEVYQWRLLSLSPFKYRCIAEQIVSKGLARYSLQWNQSSAGESANSQHQQQQHWVTLQSRLLAAEFDAKHRRLGVFRYTTPLKIKINSLVSTLIGRIEDRCFRSKRK